MKTSVVMFSLLLLLTLNQILLAQFNPSSSADDIYWSSRFAHPGLFNRAQAAASYNSNTVVFAGLMELPNEDGSFSNYLLAFWDGNGYTFAGPAEINFDAVIKTICVIGTDIFIGGQFTIQGTPAISNLAIWNGTQWSAVGSGVNGSVLALTTDGSNLYAGGLFTQAGGTDVGYIAKWDGSNWQALSEQGGLTNGVNGPVRAIAPANDGIYVGGDFTVAGGTNAYFAAKYTSGGSWEDVGIQWTVGSISSIGVAVDHVYLGGGINTTNGWPGNGIIRSDGSGGWEAMGNGSSIAVKKIIVSASGDVYAMGDFSQDAGPAANQIAKWNGSSWSALGDQPFDQAGYDFALQEPGKLFTARFGFQNQQYLYGNGIYEWDGSAWHGLGLGLGDYWTTTYTVNTLAWYNSQLIAGGNFLTAGDQFLGGLVKLNNSTWTDIGNSSAVVNLSINKLLSYNNKLYAAGNFSSFGGVTLNYIGYWDGSQWNPLGTGMDGYVVDMLPVGNDLYATGSFFNAGGIPAIGYARWDGSSWHPLGSGGPSSYALTNIGSDIYAGGQFTLINGGTLPVQNLARWDGATWYDVGGGVTMGANFTTSVFALAARGNDLIVGGNFTMAGTIPANNISVWNGSQWSALGDGLNGPVKTILVEGNEIYVGGQFTTAGTNAAYSIAKWDGSSWHPIGSGIHQSNNFVSIATVNSLLASPDGLYAGGQFTHSGDKYANMVALYTDFTTGVESTENEIPEEYTLSQNYPNPFNPTTTINFSIPQSGHVTLKVFDVLGREAVALIDGQKNQGRYSVNFNASKLSSGVYYYRLEYDNRILAKKMVLIK